MDSPNARKKGKKPQIADKSSVFGRSFNISDGTSTSKKKKLSFMN
jgi:hypothetical protein